MFGRTSPHHGEPPRPNPRRCSNPGHSPEPTADRNHPSRFSPEQRTHDGDCARSGRYGRAKPARRNSRRPNRHSAGRFDGPVIAAFGVGNVPAKVVPVVAELAGRVPVVLAARTGAGSALARSPGFSGAENELLTHGLTSAGSLDPLKARLLLHVLPSGNATRDQVTTAFAAYGAV